MAAISQKVPPARVLPLLARNVAMEGYGWYGKKARPTEYLNLLRGYLKHARALAALAGPSGVIRVTSCDEAGPLLKVLGYRLRDACGPNTYLQTADPKQAFLTIDSGFPLTELEKSLRDRTPFTYSYSASQVPVLFAPAAWMKCDRSAKKTAKDVAGNPDQELADFLVTNPRAARLYWALARMDPGARAILEQFPGLEKLLPYAPVLDFYGSEIYVRSGRVILPGGAAAEPAWRSLVGASPQKPSSFIMHLLSKDDGWMAAYYDALARAPAGNQAYFTNPRRLQAFYRALKGRSDSPQPARPVFRPNPGLVLLVNRLQIEASGDPHIPGGLRVWKDILESQRKSNSKLVREWAGRAKGWKSSDDVVGAMFGLSRVNSETGPLQLFLATVDIDYARTPAERLNPRTVRLLAANFSEFGDQYPIFAEFHALNNGSIARFISVAQALNRIHEHTTQGDAVGIFQANVSLWEVLARQGEIPTADWNDSWQRVVNPFDHVSTDRDAFNAAQRSLGALMRAASGTPQISQAALINLLAGPSLDGDQGQRVRQDLAYRMQSAMEAQGLIPLETLFALGNGLDHLSHGRPVPANLIREAGALREFKMPKPLFSTGERAEWSYGLFSNPHLQAETTEEKDLAKIIKSPPSEKGIAAVRAQLTPFLRDTLVGLNYAYYQPPGDQMLYNNPIFVRSHDFSGQAITGRDQAWKTPMIFGRGWTASGGAHLVGSLANLPYVLARVEQNFIVPDNVQALIWEDLVPTFLTNSVVPRWWRVTPDELHAVALYQQFGTDLVTASLQNQELEQKVIDILSGRMLPSQSGAEAEALRAGDREQALSLLAPADLFFLAGEFRQKFPDELAKLGRAGQQLDALCQRDPANTSWERLSEDFGEPHPALAGTYARALLNNKPFPTYLGYSSRLLAESWESNNLYWARLADQLGYAPVMLNLLAPDLTRQMIANIFATDLQDRPALLRALRQTGQQFIKSRLAASSKREVAAGGSTDMAKPPGAAF
ncbi:MAG: hypothetical protein ACRD1N_08910 [Terriglobia bacterium]